MYRSSNTFDYGVQEFRSERIDEKTFRTAVVIRRYGEATFPVDVVTTFENNEQIKETWNGQERRAVYVYERPARAATVKVDPDRTSRTQYGATTEAPGVLVLAPPTAVLRWNAVPLLGVTSIIAWRAASDNPSRIITPALAHAFVFWIDATRATMEPSPLSGW